MNILEIESSGTYSPDRTWFVGDIYSTLFGKKVKVSICMNEGETEVTKKQSDIVTDFLSLPPSSLAHIKSELFEHFEECKGYYGKRSFIKIKNKDDAYLRSSFDNLLIWDSDKWTGRAANLCFDVEWDVEHGISIVLYNGDLKEAKDIQDYYFDYEPPAERPHKTIAEKIGYSSDVGLLRQFIKDGNDIDAKDEDGTTILFNASLNEDFEMVQECIKYGALTCGLREYLEAVVMYEFIEILENQGILKKC